MRVVGGGEEGWSGGGSVGSRACRRHGSRPRPLEAVQKVDERVRSDVHASLACRLLRHCRGVRGGRSGDGVMAVQPLRSVSNQQPRSGSVRPHAVVVVRGPRPSTAMATYRRVRSGRPALPNQQQERPHPRRASPGGGSGGRDEDLSAKRACAVRVHEVDNTVGLKVRTQVVPPLDVMPGLAQRWVRAADPVHGGLVVPHRDDRPGELAGQPGFLSPSRARPSIGSNHQSVNSQ